MIRSIRVSTFVIPLMLLGVVGFPVFAESSECEARIDSELIREEEQESSTHYTWNVNVQTEEDCATVEFDLILTIQKADQEEETVVRAGRVRLSDGSIDHQMRYELTPENRLAKWEVVKSSCTPCVLDEIE